MNRGSLFAIFAGGMLFGFGLAWSGMTRPEIVLSFLRFQDYGLMLVLGSAVITTLIVFQVAPRLMTKPVLETEFHSHYSGDLKPTLVGAAIFGIGWGVCGVCPGPAIAGLGQGNWDLLACLAAMFAGAWCHGLYMSRPYSREMDGRKRSIPGRSARY